jgi:O-antigen/teichoic acid export membrane protein
LAKTTLLPTMLVSVTAAAAMAIFGRPLIRALFSHRFDASYLPMVALLPGVVLLGATKILGNDIAGRGFPHYNALVAAVALAATIAADVILIPRFGAVGASCASTLVYGLTLIMSAMLYSRLEKVRLNTSETTKSG